jgi:nucleotide-binding universal stress UspA family protein
MKVIYIPVSDSPECALALHHGFKLAQQTDSNVIGCHIRPHANSGIDLSMEPHDSIVTLDSYDLAWEAALSETDKNEHNLKAQLLFEKMANQFKYKLRKKPQKNTLCAMWSEQVGSPEKIFAINGPVSDLIMVSRPEKKGHSIARIFMFGAVVNSSTPVIVLPQENFKNLGKRICIAWNQSTEAALAVKAAMPMLQMANEVNIVTTGPEGKLGPKATHLQKYLSHWSIKSKHITSKSKNDAQSILKGYKETNSDMLVLGGYSRSRLRERVFGGVTEFMLNEANIPIFILHA